VQLSGKVLINGVPSPVLLNTQPDACAYTGSITDDVHLNNRCQLQESILHTDIRSAKCELYSWQHCVCNRNSSDKGQVTCLTERNTVTTTQLALMQNRLLALELASMYLQQH
jgi:hypothetical protein